MRVEIQKAPPLTMVDVTVTHRARILIVEIPSLLRELIGEIIADEGDMEVVGELPDLQRVSELAERTGANFVITGRTHPEFDSAYEELLRQRPAMRVLAVQHQGRQSSLYELLPHVENLGELSAETLLTVIRGGD
jgi:chemotaxis response regulator CheB